MLALAALLGAGGVGHAAGAADGSAALSGGTGFSLPVEPFAEDGNPPEPTACVPRVAPPLAVLTFVKTGAPLRDGGEVRRFVLHAPRAPPASMLV